MIDVIHGEQGDEKIGAKQPFTSHPLTQVGQGGRFFESPEMKGISVRFLRSGLPFLSSSY